ncbi:MAG: PspC domain-containing protein [Chloroflexota bacterium]
MNKLYRSNNETMISGVCGGLGQYFGIDPTIVRIFFVFLAFYQFLGVWVYLVMAILLPIAPDGYGEEAVSSVFQDGSQTTKIIGGGLIIMGIFAMLSNINLQIFSWLRFENLWPVLLILFGVVLLVRVFNQEN